MTRHTFGLLLSGGVHTRRVDRQRTRGAKPQRELTWRPVSDQFFKTSSVGAIAVAESNPDVVYVGMGETQLRGNVIQGDGVYRTSDGGKTWTHAGLESTMAIARIRVHPNNPDVAFVAALGNPYGAGPERGVFKTTDGGKTWRTTSAGARDFPGLILWAGSTRGPLAPPGRYNVKVTAGGVSRTQSFELRRNPAIAGVTDADLHEQFALARQISDRVTAAHDAVPRIRRLTDQIADRAGKTPDAAIKRAGESLAAKLTAVEGEIYQYRNRSSQDPLNFPIRLNNKLAALQNVVEGGDYKPTDQAYAVFKALSSRLDKELGRLEAMVKSDLSAFNRLLAAANLPAIVPDGPSDSLF